MVDICRLTMFVNTRHILENYNACTPRLNSQQLRVSACCLPDLPYFWGWGYHEDEVLLWWGNIEGGFNRKFGLLFFV